VAGQVPDGGAGEKDFHTEGLAYRAHVLANRSSEVSAGRQEQAPGRVLRSPWAPPSLMTGRYRSRVTTAGG
jgi:O-glycosyl hydrolase